MKLLFITTLKPMIDKFIIEQTNAILSWKKLRLPHEIIIFGDDEGVPEFCEKNNIRNIKDIKKNEKGVPYVNHIIIEAYKYADDNDIIIFCNADIILFNDLCDTIDSFLNTFPFYNSFLLTMRRYDVNDYTLIDYDNINYRDYVDKNFITNLSVEGAIDIFIHRKNNFIDMPDFAVSRMAYDNWMIDYAVKNFNITIDLTNTVKIYHQFGKWYHNGKIINRDNCYGDITLADIDKESYNNNIKLFYSYNPQYTYVTNCKYYSLFDENKIIFKLK